MHKCIGKVVADRSIPYSLQSMVCDFFPTWSSHELVIIMSILWALFTTTTADAIAETCTRHAHRIANYMYK